MRQFLTKLAVPCIMLGAFTQVRAEDLKTADEVIAKYVEAIGGRTKLDAIKTIRMTGKAIVQGGIEVPMVMEIKRPSKARVDSTFQGMTITQAYDGATGWFVMPFSGNTNPEKMPPDQVKRMESQADFEGPLVDYKKKGHTVEFAGTDEVEGTSVYKLKVNKKDGDVEQHFIDKEHYLPVSMKTKTEVQGTEMEIEVSFGDYKEVSGVIMPHSVSQKAGGMGASTIAIEKIETNVDIADDRFAMPERKEPEPVEKKDEEKPEEKKP